MHVRSRTPAAGPPGGAWTGGADVNEAGRGGPTGGPTGRRISQRSQGPRPAPHRKPAAMLFYLFAEFMGPIVSTLKGTACEERMYAVGAGTIQLSEIGDSCWLGVEDAVCSALCLLLISAVKGPELMAMLRKGHLPNNGDFPWGTMRCITEWFSILMLLAYCSHQDYPLVSYWEQIVIITHGTVAVFIVLVRENVFDDEMNSFGGSAVVGTFVWMLFYLNFDGPWAWWLPFISLLLWLPRDAFTIRFGHRNEKDGTIIVDTQFKHHLAYVLVGFIRWRGAWQHRMGTLWEPSDWWLGARSFCVFGSSLLLLVEALVAPRLLRKFNKKRAAKAAEKAAYDKAKAEVSSKHGGDGEPEPAIGDPTRIGMDRPENLERKRDKEAKEAKAS
eukprot:SAG22_NODE_46_length_24705_cov_89.861010_4_plen_387_part_00